MSIFSLRQRYLSLVARLYELAAEYDHSELTSMHNEFAPKDEKGVTKALTALIELHRAGEKTAITVPSTATYVRTKISPELDQGDTLGAASLEQLLSDRAIFRTVGDVAKAVPGNLQPYNKEARARFIKRVVQHIGTLSDRDKKQFRDFLASELDKQPHNFVSQWKKLIKEL